MIIKHKTMKKKKVILLAVMVAGAITFASAQTSEIPSEDAVKGQAVRAVAEGPETGKEKGQLVSKAAKQTGTEKSAEGRAKAEEAKAGDGQADERPENHGSDVKAVATDKNLRGKAKGDAVKTVATSKRPSRSERVAARRTVRPERAKRPATAGRPSGAGRPGN
jgi:hypothetical protein